ncbi:pyridoxamine 5'-phosphate oxidase family protein [Variovorax sp. VNK109]|uniref:pyridoxamine 5'-phosphate oxidase family protein n=1 Tax=Variovorax sp. VNK109 TaxID=3400919 RepID=UPI003C0AD82E
MTGTSPHTPSLQTSRVTLERRPTRGAYDLASVAAVLDETFLCHLGFSVEGQPYVIPTGYGRNGDVLYFHGSAASRMLRTLADGVDVCVTVTLLDAIVMARSAFNHSMNYRSAVILGRATLVEGDEKLDALKIISDQILPGRWEDARAPNDTEMRATSVLKLRITEASTKTRKGPPLDDDEDMGHPCWAGQLLYRSQFSGVEADPRQTSPVPVPDYLKACLPR